MVMRQLSAILIVLLLFIVPAAALREDFRVSSPASTINVCACSTASVPLNLANTGDVTSVYSLSLFGDAAPWATLTTQSTTLEPGQSEQAMMFVRAPCGTQGSFPLQTRVQTAFDAEASLEQRVQVDSCSDIRLVPTTQTSRTACPCTPVEYAFLLRNDGDHAETYAVSVEPADYVSIGSPHITLRPGEETPVVVFISRPCGDFGDFDHTLHVTATRAGWQSTVPLHLTVDACYEYAVLAAPAISMCKTPGRTALIPLTIQNAAAIKNTYDITTRLSGTTTAYDPVTLRAGEQQVLTLSVDLDDVPAGKSDLVISTTPRRGNTGRTSTTVAFHALVCSADGDGTKHGTKNILPIVLLITVLLAVLLGIIRSRRPQDRDDSPAPYHEPPSRVAEPARKGLASHKTTGPADLPGWFMPLLVVFIALGVLALLLGALFIVDNSVAEGGGTTYVDSLDGLSVDPQTAMPDRAADARPLQEDASQDVPLIEQDWFIASLMLIVFLVIMLLVLAIMLKTRGSGEPKTCISDEEARDDTDAADEPVSVVFKDDDDAGSVKVKRLDVARSAKTAKKTTGDMPQRQAPVVYLAALLLLLLLSGAAFAFYYLPGVFDGQGGGRLQIDSDGLLMHRGAIIARTGSMTDIPLVFKNPDESAAHVDLDVPVGWITFSQPALDIGSTDEAQVTMSVSPDESIETGRYRMEFSIETQDATYQDDVALLVLAPGENPTSAWSWVGAIALAAIIVLAFLAYRRGRKCAPRHESPGKTKAARSSNAPGKEIIETGASFAKTRRLKRKKLVIFGLGFLLVLLVCAGVFGVLWRYTMLFGDHRPAPNENARTLGEILLYTTPGIHESHVVVGDDRTILPMRITNVHDDRDYKISVYEDIPWLSVDSDQQWIPPGESVIIPLVVDADRGVDNGAYRISVDIRTADDLDGIFTNDIVIVVHHSRKAYLAMLYLPYIILGCLLVIYLFSTKRKLRRWRRSRDGDEAVLAAKKNTKTNIKLK